MKRTIRNIFCALLTLALIVNFTPVSMNVQAAGKDYSDDWYEDEDSYDTEDEDYDENYDDEDSDEDLDEDSDEEDSDEDLDEDSDEEDSDEDLDEDSDTEDEDNDLSDDSDDSDEEDTDFEDMYEDEKISLEDCTFSYKISHAYTGKKITPDITVIYDDMELAINEDYTVSYANNTKAGTTAKIMVTAVEDSAYTGSVTAYFTIKSNGKSAQVISAKSAKVKLSAKTYKLGAKLKKGNGTLTYTSSNKKIATVNTKGILKLKKKGKVTITITASATSSHKKTTKKITITVK